MFRQKTFQWANAWVLITGAASGIGEQTAIDVATRGANLVICDIDEKGLERLAGRLESMGVEVISQVVDVSDAVQMEGFSDRVHSQIEAVDVLINNAGVAVEGRMMEMTLEQWSWLMGINVWGVIYGCHYFVPKMQDAGRGGHVVNIASLAGLIAAPPLGAYAMTKFAVVGLSEALERELESEGIGVTAICPGFIRTNIARSMVMTQERARRREVFEKMLANRPGPQRVSEAIIEAVEQKHSLRPVNPEAWLMYWSKRVSPGLTRRSARLLGKLAERMR